MSALKSTDVRLQGALNYESHGKVAIVPTSDMLAN